MSIIEFAQQDITTLMHDWLNAVQYITSPLTVMNNNMQEGSQQDLLAIDDQPGSDNVLQFLKNTSENRV